MLEQGDTPGNDPHLKRVVTDHIDFPQVTVPREDALSVLNHAAGKLSPTTMEHIAMATDWGEAQATNGRRTGNSCRCPGAISADGLEALYGGTLGPRTAARGIRPCRQKPGSWRTQAGDT